MCQRECCSCGQQVSPVEQIVEGAVKIEKAGRGFYSRLAIEEYNVFYEFYTDDGEYVIKSARETLEMALRFERESIKSILVFQEMRGMWTSPPCSGCKGQAEKNQTLRKSPVFSLLPAAGRI